MGTLVVKGLKILIAESLGENSQGLTNALHEISKGSANAAMGGVLYKNLAMFRGKHLTTSNFIKKRL